MKKIISGIIAGALAISSAVGVFAAPQYSSKGNLMVESDINNAKNTKKTTVRNSAKLDITQLFKWTAVTSSRPSEKRITITSEAGRIEEGSEHPFIPVEMSLRITNAEAEKKSKYVVGETKNSDKESEEDKISVFEYYTLTVSDGDEVIFTSEDVPADTTEIEIPLRLFNSDNKEEKNTGKFSDEDTYMISLRENTDINRSNVTEYAAPTKWKWYVDAKQMASMVDGSPTPTPRIKPTEKPTPTPKASISTNTDSTDSDKSETTRKDVMLKAGDYLVGKDIAPGRYYVVGSGLLKTYDSEGTLTGNVNLEAAADANGSYSINLRKDESISLSEDAEFKTSEPAKEADELTPTPTSTPKVRVTPTPRVRATATPRTRVTPTPKAKATATPKASSSTSVKNTSAPKANPKTGDAAPIAGLSIVGVLALCAVVLVQKKKKSN